MIAPLRRRHRLALLPLALVVGALFVASILTRPPEPIAAAPAPLAPPDANGFAVEDVLHAAADAFGPIATALGAPGALDLAVVRRNDDPGRGQLVLTPRTPITAPEVLALWTTAGSDAPVALGDVSGTITVIYDLPDDALARGGRVQLHSLAHDADLGPAVEVPALVAAAPAPSIDDPADADLDAGTADSTIIDPETAP
ncbi:MAG: hypothetical protein AAF772_08660 [Acidobacteriota bacterium]